jgi:hypothetical protein
MRLPNRRAQRSSIFLVAALLAIPFAQSHGQSHWESYKPGTLAAIIDAHDSTIPANPLNGRKTVVISGDDFPTLAHVIYRGESRPIDSRRVFVMREWSLTFLRDSSMLNDFHREYLFQEGDRLLWLPVQDTVASFFAKELKPGQAATLYVIFLGAQRGPRDVAWAFAVNEFRAETYKEQPR